MRQLTYDVLVHAFPNWHHALHTHGQGSVSAFRQNGMVSRAGMTACLLMLTKEEHVSAELCPQVLHLLLRKCTLGLV